MASLAEWVEGARPRTLAAAVSPVVVGTGVAAHVDAVVVRQALLALLVALALQVGVNYANDYSDGVRGTDSDRVGPRRLVGSGTVAPLAVRNAAFACFGVAAAAGLVLAATSGWWLVAVGAVAIAAAWAYTGGSRPYGYRGLGEVFVFCFFGPVAVGGTTYVQAGTVTGSGVLAGAAVGAVAAAILVANNLRDIPTDAVAGKRTLAVMLGDPGSRSLYVGLLVLAFVLLGVLALVAAPQVVLGLVALPPAVRAARTVLGGAVGTALVPVLRDTGLAELGWAIGVAAGLALGAP